MLYEKFNTVINKKVRRLIDVLGVDISEIVVDIFR
jgi:hypothetical protein